MTSGLQGSPATTAVRRLTPGKRDATSPIAAIARSAVGVAKRLPTLYFWSM